MTVKQLIKKLKKYDQSLPVVVDVIAGTYKPKVRLLHGAQILSVAISGYIGKEFEVDPEGS